MEIKLDGHHLALSPYKLPGVCYPETCYCPRHNTDGWLEAAHCRLEDSQIAADLVPFRSINFTVARHKILEKFNEPGSVSICNYVVKDNEIFRKCYGQYTGFKMFMDAILLSMTKKMRLTDTEFFINLGDWPLVKKGGHARTHGPLPMFSWCGSEDTFDIVLPTYDLTESTLENMGRVMLDMLSVQKLKTVWTDKIEKGFWRGRDSRRERLDLIDLSRKHPDMINASLTNFFFFRDEAHKYGPKVPHISFMDFFEYKYQINIDGTVAAYRFPYLLAGGSTVFKQESTFYEHFYRQLKANFHYVPIKRDLSDLVDKIRWAQKNDEKAFSIMENGRQFAQMNLLPLDVFCYHALLLKRYTEAIVSDVVVQPGMEKVPQPELSKNCDCDLKGSHFNDEL
jgi:Glycosyl transferase family 90